MAIDASDAPELVQWLIEHVDANWPGGDRPDTLHLVDRENSDIYDGSTQIEDRKGELQDSNLLSFARATTNPTPRGPGYDLELEDVISCRLEGLDSDEWGHVDTASAFETLYDNVEEAIYTGRRDPLSDYHTLFIQNVRHASSDYRDYYLTNFEVRFWGGEELP